MTEQEKQRLYLEYTADDMRKLKAITLTQIRKFCGDANLHWDDYFSIANMTLWRVIESYDETKCDNFYAFLVDCIRRKIKTELTKINNNATVTTSTKTISFDHVTDDGVALAETIDSKKTISDELDSRHLSENAWQYVHQFDGNPRKVVEMIMDGYANDEIQRVLHLSRRDFDDIMIKLRAYKNSSILKRTNSEYRKTPVYETNTKMEETTMMGYSFNKNKTENPTVSMIQERVEDKSLLLNYVLQRDENQWTVEGKSNQISDMLQMLPLPSLTFAQRDNENGTFLTFVIDGKQRITNVLSFMNNGFKISNKVRRGVIRYNVLNGMKEDGAPDFDWREFDIRGKRFSEFPSELQKVLRGYQFDARIYMNCSDEDITYHITRYNDGKAMNSNQKSILRIGYEYAARIRKITDMAFFADIFKTSEIQKGIPEKICVEAIMASNYLDDWKKKNEDNAEYIANNAAKEDFDSLEETIDRLSDVLDDETRTLFTAKEAFTFLAVFNRFKELNLDNADEIFNDFLTEFPKMGDVEIDGVTWNEFLDMRNTKDKKVISEKIEHIYHLLTEYINRNNNGEEKVVKESESDEDEEDDLFYVTTATPATKLYDLKENDNEEQSNGDSTGEHSDNEEASDSVLDKHDEEGTELSGLSDEDWQEGASDEEVDD